MHNLSTEDIQRALDFLSSDDRDLWVKMAMAIKSELGEDGFDIWDSWSAAGSGYKQADARHVWKSCKAHGSVKIGTLIREAQQAGFKLSECEKLSNDQLIVRQKARDDARKKSELETREKNRAAAVIANNIWDLAAPAQSHPYCERKQIGTDGLRVGSWPLYDKEGNIKGHANNVLLIPIKNGKGDITTLQGIFDQKPMGYTGEKTYLTNGKKSGGWCAIGEFAQGGVVALCEGYATGATIHEQKGWGVIVCFDRSNLMNVGKQIRSAAHGAGAKIVVCADNDRFGEKNDGVKDAKAVALEIGSSLLVPEFPEGDGSGTDFNDLFVSYGAEECSRQLFIKSQVAPFNHLEVDLITPLPDITSTGKPLSTIENLSEICRRLGVTIRYNVISKDEEILAPGEAFLIDNCANASHAWLESWCSRFRMPAGSLSGFVTYLADKNPYNPVAEWISSRPWDGVSRFEELCDTVTEKRPVFLPDGQRLRDVLIKRWMLSAADAVFNPAGVSAHGVLVFQGDQYVGKTAWFKSLAPEALGVIQDGMILKPEDRDSVKQVCSFWLVELGELDATFKKSDIAALKAFITKKKDVIRRAFARKESQYARRTVFFGSVNPEKFLHDTTGNRRYWTIQTEALNKDHGLDMQQVWAEIWHYLKRGESYYLTPDEINALNDHNENFQVLDPIEERIQTKFKWNAPKQSWAWETATDILITAGIDRPTQAESTKAAHCVRKLNGDQSKRSGGKNLLLVPPAVAFEGYWKNKEVN